MQLISLLLLAAGGLIIWSLGYLVDSTRAMYGYLFAFMSVLSIPLGCMFFVIIQHATKAGWSVVTRRVAEFGMASVAILAILFVPIALLGGELFPWMHADHLDAILVKKVPYLNQSFFMIRAVIYFVIWIALGTWFYKKSLQQDDNSDFTPTKQMISASPVAIILFALSLTFASFDWLMSLQPHWYSTVFGVYYFAGCFLAGLVFIVLMLRQSDAPATQEHYQDLGKLIFGFTVFWAYIGFSQFMLYWYAHIPEEAEFYIHRMHHGWEYVSYALIVTNFLFPFLLIMSRHAKRNPFVFSLGCVWVMLAHFLDIYWLVIPTSGDHHWWTFLGYDLAGLVGLLAAYLACVSWVRQGRSNVPKNDPRLGESLAFENY